MNVFSFFLFFFFCYFVELANCFSWSLQVQTKVDGRHRQLLPLLLLLLLTSTYSVEIIKSYSHTFSIKISVKSTFCEEAEIKFMMHFLVIVNLIFSTL